MNMKIRIAVAAWFNPEMDAPNWVAKGFEGDADYHLEVVGDGEVATPWECAIENSDVPPHAKRYWVEVEIPDPLPRSEPEHEIKGATLIDAE